MSTEISAATLSPITFNSIPVITTELLAKLYGTEALRIRQNHHINKERFIEGRHLVRLTGQELREFKHRVVLNYSVKIAPNVRSLTLWTERGAARHAKMLDTDQAWDVFEQLEESYFNKQKPAKASHAPATIHHLQLTDKELCDLAWLWRHADDMIRTVEDLYPLLDLAGHRLAPHFGTILAEYPPTIAAAKQVLAREARNVIFDTRSNVGWRSILPALMS